MYDTFFFRSPEEIFNFFTENVSTWPVLSEYRGRTTPTLLGQLNDNLSMLVATVIKKGEPVASETHFILRETRTACRKDTFRVLPFFKPPKQSLWHASVDYGSDRAPLPFVVANAFQGKAFDFCSKGGVFQMRFMGLGESLECINDKGVIRFWSGLPVARERRDKNDPAIDHSDMVFDNAKALNPCDDEKAPAFAEFTSAIENVSTETICGQPCFRIRLWSGPLQNPASFPWTLLIAKARVQKGWTPRVGDFVNGIAAIFGTFDHVSEGEPTVFQPEFNPDQSIREEPIPAKDIPPTPPGKPETEWLPRRPLDYPDAPFPRVSLPVFTDGPLKKFVTYPDYRNRLGDTLVPVPEPSRQHLRTILDEIDHVITTEENRLVFAPHFDAIGIRHAVRNPATGETHLWLELPPVYLRWDRHADLLVAFGADGHALRYTLHTGDENGSWAPGEMYCNIASGEGQTSTVFQTPEEVLSRIPSLAPNACFVLCAQSRGSLFQAICQTGGQRKSWLAEWQLFGREWQFFKKEIPEKHPLELCRLFLSGGLAAIENEEPWKQVKTTGSY